MMRAFLDNLIHRNSQPQAPVALPSSLPKANPTDTIIKGL